METMFDRTTTSRSRRLLSVAAQAGPIDECSPIAVYRC
jgi:hypothetical protein